MFFNSRVLTGVSQTITDFFGDLFLGMSLSQPEWFVRYMKWIEPVIEELRHESRGFNEKEADTSGVAGQPTFIGVLLLLLGVMAALWVLSMTVTSVVSLL